MWPDMNEKPPRPWFPLSLLLIAAMIAIGILIGALTK